ncbi:hypothetical protein HD554DRAFT_2178439 [Boletus coccyginus]|nr:hypothetical protein HD554DRAFT_2178439 [Boletus coccyginus]
MSPNYPQLPFTLRYCLCYGPLFSCLSYSYKSLPIVRVDTLYQLEPNLLARWDALDCFLTAVTHGLQMLAPMNVVLHLVPQEANYTRPQKTEKSACGTASYALRCFQHLISLMSWAISGYSSGLDRTDLEWVKVLLQKGFEPSMVQMLKDSPVGTFSLETPRVGTLVHACNPECLVRVSKMVLAQVPIYIYWGTCDCNAKRSFRNFPPTVLEGRWVSQNCYPSDEDLVKAVEFALDVGPSEPSIAEPHVAEPRVPKPEKGSGQKKGETWQQFFARRAEGNKAKQAHETLTQLLARQAHAKHALKDRVPGRGGAVVFQWMDVGGFRIRSSIGHDLAGLLWEDYTETQRRYDPFANQWDICTEFDPSAVPVEESDFDDDFEPQPLEPGNTAADPSTHHTTTFVGDTIPMLESPQFPPLEDVLYERYGFVYSPSQQPAPPSTPISQLAMKICKGQATLPHSRTLRDAAAAFLAGLIDGRSLNSPDMLDGSLRDQYMSGSVTVKRCQGTRIALEGSSTSGVFYLINFRQTTSSPFSICLDDPMAVLQVIRAQFGANSPDLALQLASRGIPFSTRIASSKLPTPIPPKVLRASGSFHSSIGRAPPTTALTLTAVFF